MSRKVTLALFASLAAVAIGACAKPADDARLPIQVVTVASLRAAPDVAAAAGSGRFEVRVGPAAGDLVASGAFAEQQVSVDIDLAPVLSRAARTTPGASIPSGIDTTMRVVVDGSSVYLQAPMLQMLSGATGWISLTPDDLGGMSDTLGMRTDLFDPSKLLEMLRDATADMRVVGSEVVRGSDTTHVRADLAGSSQHEGSVDVWLDGDGLVRRIRMAAAGLGSEVGDAEPTTVTIELFDYGEPVEIDVPLAHQATPLSELLGSFLGAGA